jgi:hypothetical protein
VSQAIHGPLALHDCAVMERSGLGDGAVPGLAVGRMRMHQNDVSTWLSLAPRGIHRLRQRGARSDRCAYDGKPPVNHGAGKALIMMAGETPCLRAQVG